MFLFHFKFQTDLTHIVLWNTCPSSCGSIFHATYGRGISSAFLRFSYYTERMLIDGLLTTMYELLHN